MMRVIPHCAATAASHVQMEKKNGPRCVAISHLDRQLRHLRPFPTALHSECSQKTLLKPRTFMVTFLFLPDLVRSCREHEEMQQPHKHLPACLGHFLPPECSHCPPNASWRGAVFQMVTVELVAASNPI